MTILSKNRSGCFKLRNHSKPIEHLLEVGSF